MKPYQSTKAFSSILKIGILPCFLFSIIACNNEKSGTGTSSDSETTASTGGDSSSNQMTHQADFTWLKVEKTTLENTLNISSSIKAIVFISEFSDTRTANPFLNGFPIKSNGKYYRPNPQQPPNPSITLIEAPQSETINGLFYLSDVQLNKDYYNSTILPHAASSNCLYFQPYRNSNNYISYNLIWGDCNSIPDIRALTVRGNLNPSPPADPGQ